jgi:hypothetical protein
MLQRDGVVMVEMKVLVMEMMMMIPMKSGAMVMTMAMISPFREGISLADFCLPESFSLSSVFRPTEVAVSISEPPLAHVFEDDEIREGVMAEVGQGALTIGRCVARGWAAPPGGEAALWPLSPPPCSYFSLLVKYNFLVFFWNFLIFRNMVS